MKLDEDFGPDREDGFQTEDEENQAQTVYDDNDDYGDEYDSSQSDLSLQNPSVNCIDVNSQAQAWPQSYRNSIDLLSNFTPPSLSFLRGSRNNGSSFTIPVQRRSSSPLSRPLISSEIIILDHEEHAHPQLPSEKIELPLPQELCSFSQSVFNGINVLCGIGILTVPYTISEGGWLSLVLLLIITVISGYTGVLLKRCLESSPGLKTYPDIGQAAFGTIGRVGIAIALYIDLYASCVEYIIMMSDNLASLFPNAAANVSGICLNAHQVFAVTATLIVLPTVWLRNLSLLSYLSVGGILTSILVVLCLLWVGTMDLVGFHPTGTALNVMNVPFTVAIYGFCFSGHSVFPNIYSSMKKPSQFPLVILVCFSFCLLLYAGTSVCGYLMFADAIESQFTLNMPKELMATKIAIWTVVVNPMTKFALTIMPVSMCLEELLPSRRRSYLVAVMIRTILTLSTLIVAVKLPFFGFVMTLMGSLLAMLVTLIFPCACYLKLLHARLGKLDIMACIFMIVIGIFCSIIGTYSAISKLVTGMR